MNANRFTIRRQLVADRSFDWRWLLAAAVLAFQLLFAAWLVGKPGGDEALLWFDDVTFVLAPSLASLTAALVAASHWGARTGYAWALIALGLFMTAFGETAWGVQELGMGIEVPFPSVADIGYLGIYPPVFLGLLLMPQAPVSGLRRLKFSLDTLTAMLAIAVISWYLILANLINESGESALSKSIAVAYPFADLGIIFAVLVLIGRGARALSGATLACLGGGFVAIAFSDSLYTYLTSVQNYATGNYIDIGWMLGYNLVTLAALIALSRRIVFEDRAPDEEPPSSFWPSLIPYAGLIPLAAVHAFAFIRGQEDRPLNVFLEGGTLAVIALVGARQLLTIFDNVRLNRQLAELTAELEVKVKEQRLRLMHSSGRATTESPGMGEPASGSDEPVEPRSHRPGSPDA